MFPLDLLIYLPLIIFIWIPIIAYYWALSKTFYWKRKGIPYVPALPFIGNLKDCLTYKKCFAEQFQEIYLNEQFRDEPIIGINVFHKPALLVKDPEVIKKILVKDFNSFVDRRSFGHTDPLAEYNLFFIRGKSWKKMRPRLTPTFTAGKLKQMFVLLQDIGRKLENEVSILAKSNLGIAEVTGLCSRFTIDVIASCIFGIEANSIQNKKSEFFRKGRHMFDFRKIYRSIEFTSFFLLPELVPIFNFNFCSKETSKFFRESITYTMDEREKSGSIRNDLIDTLVTLKKEDQFKISDESEVAFQGDVLIAQASIFFVAGFESTSALMYFTLYELCWNHEIQNRLREEIRTTLKNCNDELSYDIVNNMEYLSMVISESLRLYSPLPFLDRLCSLPKNEKEYIVDDDGKLKIPNGTPIIIPVFAIHRDPKFFPNPDKFDPERFSSENKHKIHPYTYMPFGVGPRNCLGERFGLMQGKVGLIRYLKNYRVEPSEDTPKVMKLEPKSFVISPKNLHFNLKFIYDPLV